MKEKELAELRIDARPQKTDIDDKFAKLASHPLARRWLRRSLREEMRAALAAGPGAERAAHRQRIKELREMLRPEPKERDA